VTEDRAVVAMLEEEWSEIEQLCSPLTEEEWLIATDLPGWSVKDVVSHIIGVESFMLGRALPDHTPPDAPHVRNEMGRFNEVVVDYRRTVPGEKVLQEFREVTGERLDVLRSWSDDDFDAESWTPIGSGKARDLLSTRLMDCWVHEQDIRRALGQPGRLEGRVASHSFNRLVGRMPYVVGKKVAPPDGTTVVFDVSGGAARPVAVGMVGGRGSLLEEIPGDPSCTLAMDLETFCCLACGRWFPDQTRSRVTIRGDQALGARVLDEMNFMI
jgi:uncharacterized protein (TIGR03083 family)